MTQEEKAKAYDEAIGKAAALYKASEPMSGCNVILETLFPELKESEDEKIREELIEYIRKTTCVNFIGKCSKKEAEKFIAWIEKQEGCEYIKKDWLEHIKQSWYKEGFIDGKYSGGTSKEWTISDAATLKELIDFLENGTAKLQHDLTRYANWLKNQFTPIEKQGEQKPSDDEMKALLRTEYEKGRADAIAEMQKEWSEEDESMRTRCIGILGKCYMGELPTKVEEELNWLNSLRPQSKNEWSEEDETTLNSILSCIKRCLDKDTVTWYLGKHLIDLKRYEPMFDWLKSIKQRIGG